MASRELIESERHIVETIGEFIKFWGFSKHHGRIWALLYLSEDPLSSPDIQDSLDMSAGLVSMSLKELQHWDVISKVWVQGDRKDYYTANTDVWHMITRVLREREFHHIEASKRELEDALGDLETTEPGEGLSPEHLEYLKPRVESLIEMSDSFGKFLNMLLTQAEANIDDLKRTMGKLPD